MSTEFLLSLQTGTLVFLGVMLLIAGSNLRRLRRLGEYPESSVSPLISVCVPARNEEASIRACVESLARQDYPHYEVLVLDDGSTDGTPQILTEMAQQYSHVRVLQSKPLPSGWPGKHWACHQLSQAAKGDLLLFADADTRHHPSTLSQAADALVVEQADLLAALPHQETGTWAERWLIPIIPFSILALLPLELAHRFRLPVLSAAIGQYMLFRRTAYEQIGGHAAVRDSMVDDIALARRIKRHGLRWRMADGTKHITCRMYRNQREVIDGLSRTLFAVFDQNLPIHLFVWLWLLIVFCLPFGMLLAGLAGLSVSTNSLWLALAAIGGSLLLWAMIYRRIGFSLAMAMLYPATIAGSVLLALRSMVMTRRGQVIWKGRRISTVQPDRGIPEPNGQIGLEALKAILSQHSVLAALSVFHARLGDIFRIRAGAFQPVVLAGPEACRFVLVEAKEHLSWRPDGDPVTELLRGGLLVQDGETHDSLRRLMNPALHRRMMDGYVDRMWRRTDEVTAGWRNTQSVDMLAEMRKAALLILMDTLFAVDLAPHLARMLPAILKAVAFISPGAWVIWPGVPRLGYRRHIQALDAYLHQIIRERREQADGGDDLLSLLVRHSGLTDALIRDQILTMLIAGHDTSTALLSWTLYLMGQHSDVFARVRNEVDTVLSAAPPDPERLPELCYLEQVIQETLRLYPPIHIGNRIARRELTFQDYVIPAGTRVTYSIYLTHRDPHYWVNPDQFDPNRFTPTQTRQHPPYAYLPFGGGARNCMGMVFALVEAKVVLARLIQTFDFEAVPGRVSLHMGATLEPRPGVAMHVRKRR